MEPRFDHVSEEPALYKAWEESGTFTPERNVASGLARNDSRTFSMVLPPPNVTGTLHLGHASMLAIEDILARYHRMKGERTLWIPGTDHAAIATQEKVEKNLYKETGQSRHDLGREAFLRRVEEFAQESHDTITSQVRAMGASVDWTREAYTLDATRNAAVNEMFVRMYEDGLIYRGARIVNWDPKMQTTVSDEEVDYKDEQAPLYYLQYGPFEIATARPETKFGDKYVVVHPDDPRYAQYENGQTFNVEWINGPVIATLIKDPVMDMAFGTGAMTITPWHDAVDFELAERHQLDRQQVIDERGKLMEIAGDLAGMSIASARPLVVEKLRAKGLVTRVDENYAHRIAVSSRGGGKIEPQIKEQWFVAVNKPFVLKQSSIDGIAAGSEVTLAKLADHVVETGLIDIIPDYQAKTYFHWVRNLRDWCISRQIWYGHRIPAWYRNGETYVGRTAPEGEGWVQDPDTLDTWFSSGMWTFSTLGWPEQTEDLATYHPTAVLETGYDILPFWVMRMILMTTYALGTVPFRTVYLHGLVQGADGKKMSKSKTNGIDPLVMIEKYGADAVRMALVVGATPGTDIRLSEDKIRGYRNFTTKLWNIARFVDGAKPAQDAFDGTFSDADRALIAGAQELKDRVAMHLEKFELHLAAEAAYHYAWHTFADKIIEDAKPRLRGEDAADAAAAYAMLEEILHTVLVTLHPFMPFVTEKAHEQTRDGGFLATTRWNA